MRESVAGSTHWKRIMAGLMRTEYRKVRGSLGPMAGACSVLADAYLDCTEERLIEEGSGDTDKLQRNVMDALKDAGVYFDDAQVVDQRLRKWAVRGIPSMPVGMCVQVFTGRLP